MQIDGVTFIYKWIIRYYQEKCIKNYFWNLYMTRSKRLLIEMTQVKILNNHHKKMTFHMKNI